MKFRFLIVLALVLEAFFTISCSSNNSTAATSGTGLLYLATQGNSSLTGYGITLGSGGLTGINEVSTGTNPVAIAITPALDALFLTNSSSNFVTSYSVGSDGSLTVGSNTNTGSTPLGLTVDPSGKFLFVANQASSNISVYTISGTALTPVPNSPFTTIVPGTTAPTGPVSVAVPPLGNYLYVANQFTNSVSVFTYDSASGALARPRFALRRWHGAFSRCDLPERSFSTGIEFRIEQCRQLRHLRYRFCHLRLARWKYEPGFRLSIFRRPGPGAIAFDPGFNFVYVVDQQSNQVSQYSFGTGSGMLTPLSPAAVSTGTTPVSIAIRSGATSADIGNPTLNLTDYAYVANIGGTSLSIYTLTTGSGLLTSSVRPSPPMANPPPSPPDSVGRTPCPPIFEAERTHVEAVGATRPRFRRAARVIEAAAPIFCRKWAECAKFHVEHIVTSMQYVQRCHDGNPKMELVRLGSRGYSDGGLAGGPACRVLCGSWGTSIASRRNSRWARRTESERGNHSRVFTCHIRSFGRRSMIRQFVVSAKSPSLRTERERPGHPPLPLYSASAPVTPDRLHRACNTNCCGRPSLVRWSVCRCGNFSSLLPP